MYIEYVGPNATRRERLPDVDRLAGRSGGRRLGVVLRVGGKVPVRGRREADPEARALFAERLLHYAGEEGNALRAEEDAETSRKRIDLEALDRSGTLALDVAERLRIDRARLVPGPRRDVGELVGLDREREPILVDELRGRRVQERARAVVAVDETRPTDERGSPTHGGEAIVALGARRACEEERGRDERGTGKTRKHALLSHTRNRKYRAISAVGRSWSRASLSGSGAPTRCSP